MTVPLSHFVIRKNQSSLFLKKKPNLARILSYTLCYQLEISAVTNVTNVTNYLLMFMHAQKKSKNDLKFENKLSVKLTVQVSDGFKKLVMLKLVAF